MLYSWGNVPGVVIAGLRGGSGKTIISLGITVAWRTRQFKVAPFKKGPDYIDAGWLSKAAGHPCYNLDTYLCDKDVVLSSYLKHTRNFDIAVVEGNRGLYDGIDIDGTTSTAELAKLLNLPILLVMDCTKSTRTMAALLMGCMKFDADTNICGVILNRVAGKRHEKKIRSNIKRFCDIPVFGALPKLAAEDFPERHMGLVTLEEHAFSGKALEDAKHSAAKYIDLDGLYAAIMGIHGKKNEAAAKKASEIGSHTYEISVDQEKVTIGVVRDSAFQFYYPDNIEAIEKLGAEIVFISPLTQKTIPDVDAIYMGGGFPETHAAQLADNYVFKKQLKGLSKKGLPIYAECGGFIFLGESIELNGQVYPMSGILPVRFGLSKKPQGHGYTEVEVAHENPFYQCGERLRGHEFRYSRITSIDYMDQNMAFRMERGKGIIDKKDGFFKNNTFGTYTHLHALGSPSWAPALVNKAKSFKASKS
ncbi:MAG: cobyrinic acid a,c-diamide synthase [Desulfobacterales bacterium]|nr:MAG: cobyrinic acid a,c-diamide synthase [Desulfobacterales bacterium]